MGYECKAWAVIGVPLDERKLSITRKVDGCDCQPRPKGKFCAECGAPAKKTVTDNILDLDRDEDEPLAPGIHLRRLNSEGRTWMLGQIVSTDHGGNCVGSPAPTTEEVERVRQAVQAILEPHGLWRPDDFGLYAALEESC